MFWTNIRIKPTPNSTADNIRKKKVNEIKFKLSNKNPITKAKAYKVIHSSSAVNNKWSAVFTFITMLTKNKKNIKKIKFISPIFIIYKFNLSIVSYKIGSSLKL